jgi:hypothetical protein
MSATEAKENTNPGSPESSTAVAAKTPPADGGADGEMNSASGLIEAPLKPGGGKLRQHDFPDGGGSGGAEAFRRKTP